MALIRGKSSPTGTSGNGEGLTQWTVQVAGAGIMNMAQSVVSGVSAANVVESSPPLAWQDILKLYGVTRMPGDEDPFMRDFILCSTAQRLIKYGEEMIKEQRDFLLTSLEYLASLV